MSYTAWESETGEALQQVATFCRHLLRNGSSFTEDSQPPDTEVEIYLSNNHAKMAGILARFGISAAQTDPLVIRILQSYQVACTVVDVERAQAGSGVAKVANLRFQSFLEQCGGFEKFVASGNIQGITGVVSLGSTNVGPEWTGASLARKAIIAADTDRVQPDITREMMKNPLASNSEDTE